MVYRAKLPPPYPSFSSHSREIELAAIVAAMATYVLRSGSLVDKRTGEKVELPFGFVGAPMLMKPMPEYASPVDGKIISSRQQRRDDLKANGCREWDPADSPTRGTLRNKAVAAKRGYQVSEEFR